MLNLLLKCEFLRMHTANNKLRMRWVIKAQHIHCRSNLQQNKLALLSFFLAYSKVKTFVISDEQLSCHES